MIFYSCVTLLTCALALLVKKAKQATGPYRCNPSVTERSYYVNRVALVGIFLILFLVAAFRNDVGADYNVYVSNAHDYMHGAYVVTEPGYNVIVRILYTLFDSEPYYLIFGLFAFGTVVLFLYVLYQESEWFALSFAMFMLTGMYFISFSSVRYYFALGGAMLAMRFLLKKQYVAFVLTTLFFALFHKSILIILPVYLLAILPWRQWMLVVMALAASTVIFFRDFCYGVLMRLYPSYVNDWALETGTSVACILRCIAVLVLGVLFHKEAIRGNRKNKFYMILNYMGLLLYACGAFIPFLSRIGYYLICSQLLLVPAILRSIENRKVRRIFTGLVIAACIGYFVMFLRGADSVGLAVLPYRTFALPGFEMY